jgi:hypothetical protein
MKNSLKLAYLANKPKTIWWKVIAPKNARLSPIQRYDLIYDEKDLKIRRLI